ncbi:D-amino-acid transaminase [Paenibacillus sp. J31TS4]|uniref:D-amino-acid transaminase n=1 Tax=Paenibacillus sp. J31TS4 TaxID=2807195 RepID=UPI001B0F926E|nr:D-amino-acid transaminase [Paenibacillus sp. J31TS4]GIP37921.1 D-amino-acid transaminase [Paenibacillus sp. J31TS4]
MILFNGRIVEDDQVAISPTDRGYNFGDGIYEVFRIYGGQLFEREAHMARLSRSAAAIRLRLPWTIDELDRQLRQLMEAQPVDNGTLYIQITRCAAPRNHAFPAQGEAVVVAFIRELPRPVAALENGIQAVTMEDIRWLRCDIKSLNLLPNVLAKQEALDRGAGEAIFHRGATVTECSSSNFMAVKDGIVYTHPATNLILHGVTRGVLLQLAAQQGIAVVERPFDLAFLAQADEAFLSGTTSEITPIVGIDGRPVGDGAPGPVTRRLQQAFERRVQACADGKPE